MRTLALVAALDKPGLTLRGKSGDATRVVFDGQPRTGLRDVDADQR